MTRPIRFLQSNGFEVIRTFEEVFYTCKHKSLTLTKSYSIVFGPCRLFTARAVLHNRAVWICASGHISTVSANLVWLVSQTGFAQVPNRIGSRAVQDWLAGSLLPCPEPVSQEVFTLPAGCFRLSCGTGRGHTRRSCR